MVVVVNKWEGNVAIGLLRICHPDDKEWNSATFPHYWQGAWSWGTAGGKKVKLWRRCKRSPWQSKCIVQYQKHLLWAQKLSWISWCCSCNDKSSRSVWTVWTLKPQQSLSWVTRVRAPDTFGIWQLLLKWRFQDVVMRKGNLLSNVLSTDYIAFFIYYYTSYNAAVPVHWVFTGIFFTCHVDIGTNCAATEIGFNQVTSNARGWRRSSVVSKEMICSH
jgi:hypothetical protein